MIEMRYLQAFQALVEHGNFTRAGRSLRIATSAVSRQIRLLEASCGEQLFFRTSHEVRLTPAGQALATATHRFAADTAAAFGPPGRPRLRIGSLEGVLQHWLTELVASESLFAQRELAIRVAPPDELMRLLAAGELDAAFLSFVHRTPVPAGFRIHRLFREDITLISRAAVDPHRLERYPWICYGPDTWLMRHTERRPARVIYVNHMRTIVELVRRGLGVAMVPGYLLGPKETLIRRPIEKFAGSHICLVTPRYDRVPTPLAEFLAVVRKHAPQWQAMR